MFKFAKIVSKVEFTLPTGDQYKEYLREFIVSWIDAELKTDVNVLSSYILSYSKTLTGNIIENLVMNKDVYLIDIKAEGTFLTMALAYKYTNNNIQMYKVFECPFMDMEKFTTTFDYIRPDCISIDIPEAQFDALEIGKSSGQVYLKKKIELVYNIFDIVENTVPGFVADTKNLLRLVKYHRDGGFTDVLMNQIVDILDDSSGYIIVSNDVDLKEYYYHFFDSLGIYLNTVTINNDISTIGFEYQLIFPIFTIAQGEEITDPVYIEIIEKYFENGSDYQIGKTLSNITSVEEMTIKKAVMSVKPLDMEKINKISKHNAIVKMSDEFYTNYANMVKQCVQYNDVGANVPVGVQ